MSIAHTLALVALLATASHAADARAEGTGTRYFELINASHDSVVSASAAPAGDGTFVPIAIAAPLRGGFTAATVEVSGAHCVQDFRIGFRDGRTLLYRDIDVCRSRGLRLGATDGRRGDGRANGVLADRAH
jgi:hypothetical protein